jgi:protein TIF31
MLTAYILQIHIAVVLQAQNRHAASIVILDEVYRISCALFGASHMLAGTTMNQLTQAHFLNGDIKKAAECAKTASDILRTRLGPEDVQAKEAAKNYEILSGAIEQSEKQQEAAKKQLEQIRALQQARQAAPISTGSKTNASVNAANQGAAATADPSQPGQLAANEQGLPSDVDVDALVKYIQGQTKEGSSSKNRGKNALRGKKRTGAKR